MSRLAVVLALALGATAVLAAGLVSGLQPGEDVMPFTSNVVTGPYRGMQHCFVCDAKPKQPCMVAFLGQADEAAGRFVAAFRSLLLKTSEPPLAWFVFLTEEGSRAEAVHEDVVGKLAVRAGLTRLNVTVLGDPKGPPGYRVNPDAALTVHLYRRFVVKHTLVWPRAGWNAAVADAAAREVLAKFKTVVEDTTEPVGPPIAPGPPPGFVPVTPGPSPQAER